MYISSWISVLITSIIIDGGSWVVETITNQQKSNANQKYRQSIGNLYTENKSTASVEERLKDNLTSVVSDIYTNEIIIGRGSERIRISKIRNYGQLSQTLTNNNNRRQVTEQLRLFHYADIKQKAIFSIDEHESCKTWADAAKCKQTDNMMLNCDEQGIRCEKISCRRSCDIVSLSTTNEVPCKKKQRRDWYDDLRDEYLDHLNPKNVLRTEALFKLLFFCKAHDVFIAEYGGLSSEYMICLICSNCSIMMKGLISLVRR